MPVTKVLPEKVAEVKKPESVPFSNSELIRKAPDVVALPCRKCSGTARKSRYAPPQR
ncbi:MAG: hypothetical protein R3D26_17920 [Cyanobacteriota/Melainabacteria group bacterium]